MLAGLAQELDVAALGECDERIEGFRHPLAQLSDDCAGQRERTTKLAVGALNGIEQHLVHRDVTALRNTLGDQLVERRIPVVETTRLVSRQEFLQPVRLMNLKVEDDIDHKISCEGLSITCRHMT